MKIELTPFEIKQAQKAINNHRKFRRMWKYFRWLIVFGSLLHIMVFLGHLWLLEKTNAEEIRKINSSDQMYSDNSLKDYIDVRAKIIQRQFKHVYISIPSGIIGFSIFIFIIAFWNHHKVEPLNLKIYKALIDQNNE